MVLFFLILKALVCAEVGMERGVIFETLLAPYQHFFQREKKEPRWPWAASPRPWQPLAPAFTASSGFKWAWQVLERKQASLCVFPA